MNINFDMLEKRLNNALKSQPVPHTANIPEHPKNKIFIPIRYLSVSSMILTAVLIVSLTAYIFYPFTDTFPFDENPTVKNVESSTSPSQSKIDESSTSSSQSEISYEKVPSWYLPAHMDLISISYEKSALQNLSTQNYAEGTVKPSALKTTVNNANSKNVVVNLNPDFMVKRVIGTKWLDVSGGHNETAHKNCNDVFYNIDTGKFICISHMAKKTINLPESSEVRVFNDLIGLERCVVSLGNSANPTAYYVIDFSNEKARKLPDSFSNISYESIGSPDMRYILFSKAKTLISKGLPVDDVYLLNLDDLSVKMISGTDNAAYIHMGFSSTGKFAWYTVRNADGEIGEGKRANIKIYEIATEKSFAISGQHKFIRDDTLIVSIDNQKHHIYDTSTGAMVTESVKINSNEYAFFSLRTGNCEYNFTPVQNNLISGAKKDIGTKPIDAYIVGDNQYLFTYAKGDSNIICTDMGTLETFNVPLADEYIAELREAYSKGFVRLNLYLNQSITEVMIYYYIEADTHPSQNKMTNEQGEAVSIFEVDPNEQTGYLTLHTQGVLQNKGSVLIDEIDTQKQKKVEGSFIKIFLGQVDRYKFNGINEKSITELNPEQTALYKVTVMNKNDSKKLCVFMFGKTKKGQGYIYLPDEKAYSYIDENSVFNITKILQEEISTQIIISESSYPDFFQLTVDELLSRQNKNQIMDFELSLSKNPSMKDMNKVREILNYFKTLNYSQITTAVEYKMSDFTHIKYQIHFSYEIDDSIENQGTGEYWTFEIGISADNKPFVKMNIERVYAYISQSDYDRITEICRQLYESK